MPRRTFQQDVQRLRPVVRRHRLGPRLVRETGPPLLELADDAFAVLGNLASARERAFLRRNVRVLDGVIDALRDGFVERFADAENVMRQQAYCTVAVRD